MIKKNFIFFAIFSLLFLFFNFVKIDCQNINNENNQEVIVSEDSFSDLELDEDLLEIFDQNSNIDEPMCIDFSNSSEVNQNSLKNKIKLLISFLKLEGVPFSHKISLIFNMLKNAAVNNIKEYKNWYIAASIVSSVLIISGGLYYYA